MNIETMLDGVLGELTKYNVDVSGCTGKFRVRLKKELNLSLELGVSMNDTLTLIDSLDDVVGWEYYGLRSKVTS